jgi:hypothetical protein
MEVSYTITPRDEKRLTEYAARQGCARFTPYFIGGNVGCSIVSVVIPLAIAGYYIYRVLHDGDWFNFVWLPVIFSSWITAPFKWVYGWWKARKNAASLPIQTVRIGPDALVHDVPSQETAVKWTGCTHVGDDKHGIYILTKYEAGDMASSDSKTLIRKDYIVPKRAFESPARAKAFHEEAEGYWKAGAGQQTPTAEPTGDVSFSLTPEDLAHFTSLRAGGKKTFQVVQAKLSMLFLIVCCMVIAGSVGYTYFSIASTGIHMSPLLLAGLAIPIGIVILMIWSSTQSAGKTQFQSYPGMVGQAAVSLTPEHFIRETERERIRRPWSAITDVTIDERVVAFFSQDQRNHYVPVRAFASPSMAEAFHRRAVAYWKGEEPGSADAPGDEAWPPPPRLDGRE